MSLVLRWRRQRAGRGPLTVVCAQSKPAVAALVLLKLVMFAMSILLLAESSAEEQAPTPVAPSVTSVFPPGGQRGQAVAVRLNGKPEGGQFWSDRGQLAVSVGTDAKTATVEIPADATPGLHWLRCFNAAGAGVRFPFLVGVIPEVAESEPNNRVATAQPLSQSAQTINGVLSKSGDVDVYQVTLKAQQTAVLSVTANQILGAPVDAVLQVVDAAGTTLAHNDDDHRLDPELVFTAPHDGTWFVRVFGFPASPNSTIRLAGGSTYVYRLTVTTDAFVDYATPPVVDGAPESRVLLTGWNIPPAQRTVTVSPLRPESFVVAAGLSVPLEIGRSEVRSLAEGQAATTEVVLPPVRIAGVIDAPGQQDVYGFDAGKGQRLTFAVSAFQEHSSLDAVLNVRAADGKLIKSADDIARDNFDASLTLTMPADGRYRIEVTDRYQAGSPRHFYRLSVLPVTPSVTATLSSDRLTASRDQPLEVPVTIARANGHAAAVRVQFVDLPAGVTAEPIVSEAQADTAGKVTLQLQVAADAAPFSGVVRVIAEDDRRQQDATAALPTPLPASAGRTSQIWLTVPAAP